MESTFSVSSRLHSKQILTPVSKEEAREEISQMPYLSLTASTGTSLVAHPGSANRQAGRQADLRLQLLASDQAARAELRKANGDKPSYADLVQDCLEPWVIDLPQADAVIEAWRRAASHLGMRESMRGFVVLMDGLKNLGGCSPDGELGVLELVQDMLTDLSPAPELRAVLFNACAVLSCRNIQEVKGIASGDFLITLHQASLDATCDARQKDSRVLMQLNLDRGEEHVFEDPQNGKTVTLMQCVRKLMECGVRQFALERMDESAAQAFKEFPPPEGSVRQVGDMRWEVRVLAQKSTDDTDKFDLPSVHIPHSSPLSLSKTKYFLQHENLAENLERVLDAGLVLDPKAVCHYLSQWSPLRALLDDPSFCAAIGLAAPQEGTAQNAVQTLVQRSGLGPKLSRDFSLGRDCKRLRDEARHPDADEDGLAIPQLSERKFDLHRKRMFQPRTIEAEIKYWVTSTYKFKQDALNKLHKRLELSPEQDQSLAYFLRDLRHTQVQPRAVQQVLSAMRDSPEFKAKFFTELASLHKRRLQDKSGRVYRLDDANLAKNWGAAQATLNLLATQLPLGRRYYDPIFLSQLPID
jgi:hypothetical protein